MSDRARSRISLDYSASVESDTTFQAELSESRSMAPNNRGGSGWGDDSAREKQRPPTYNPEDYALALRKWGKRSPGTSNPALTMTPGQLDSSSAPPSLSHSDKDYRNPCQSPGGEMSLRQFGSLSELLTKLRADLRLAFPSFVQEFISEPLDGVSLVVEALRSIQLSQTSPAPAPATSGALTQQPSGPVRLPPAQQRRALLDELACLQCLQSCCQRYQEAARRLVACPAGLYALAACIMSTVNKSRILALQLLTTACEVSSGGHAGVSEALSTLRLRYGEPCRFRFLAGMVQSGGGDLPAAGLRLLAALLRGAPSPRRRLYLQAELDQAGLDVTALRKAVSRNPSAEQVLMELSRYERQLIDVDGLSEKATEAEKEKDDMRIKLELLEKRVQILQEEKGILLSLEQCLKERCCELQDEVTSLRSEHGNSSRKKVIVGKQKTVKRENCISDESSPPEDEGISSSERSLSPDDDMQREPMVYEVFNVQNETILMRSKPKDLNNKPVSENTTKKMSDDEEETTIEEVIEELRNIVNDAESEQYAKEKLMADGKSSQFNEKTDTDISLNEIESRNHKDLEKKDSITSLKHTIIITDSTNYQKGAYQADSESEIIPAKLLPQPPRKSKSLVHLFIPVAEQGVICNDKRTLAYEEEQQYYSSDEGSDSLLSASRCQPQILPRPNKQEVFIKTNNRSLLNTIMDARERAAMAEKRELLRRARVKSGEECRRQAVKRADSFQRTEQSVGIVSVNDLKVERDSYDGLYYIKEPDDYKNERLQQSTKQRQDYAALIEAKKMTKSLDRIDEGLDSMVDIVLTSENKNYNWNNTKSSNDPSKEYSSASRSLNRRRNNSRNNTRHNNEDDEEYENSRQLSDPSHRLYFPASRLSSSSFEQLSGNNGSNTSFVLKRGNVNAGLYSGQNCGRENSSVNQNRGLGSKDLGKKLPMSVQRGVSNGLIGIGKVTDIPSGLY
ncbi:multiple wing hairs isoform X2 [Arctopsyche grandis]|uniref:multiple wing hairs isoform X2 n=1 Tax=Arctopsyche grandis TaxID=121162 RepID=UPI00406D8CE4